MPAAIAVPLIVGAASAGAGVVGAKMQSNAVNKAAKLQTAAADKSQAFNQQVYNDQRHDLQPFVQGGTSAFQQLLGNWQAKQPGYQPPQPQAQQAPSPFGQAMQPQQPQGGGMVQLRAPDGSVQGVPAHLADQFMAKGAVRV